MIEKNVIIEKNRIYLEEDNMSIVMDVVSKELMEFYSNIVSQNGGDVLDVGFGLGYSADAIYKNVGNYSCIEGNAQIYKNALEWAKDKPNVTIYFGNWIDVIPTLTRKFDGIFMDTYLDDNYSKFEEYAKLIANENCVLSIFSYFVLRDTDKIHSSTFKIDSPYRKTYPKLIEQSHEVNWTYFLNGEFEKKQNTSII